MVDELIVNIGKGIAAGTAYAAWGYIFIRERGEAFSGPKFLRAVAIGAASGAASGYTGLPLPAAETWLHEQLYALGMLGSISGLLDQACSRAWKWLRSKGVPENPIPTPPT